MSSSEDWFQWTKSLEHQVLSKQEFDGDDVHLFLGGSEGWMIQITFARYLFTVVAVHFDQRNNIIFNEMGFTRKHAARRLKWSMNMYYRDHAL